jgi:hypothetical protein
MVAQCCEDPTAPTHPRNFLSPSAIFQKTLAEKLGVMAY